MRKWTITSIMTMVLMVALVGVMAWGLINREWIVDYVRSVSYRPSSEMARIRDDLKLTSEGEFLFNAVQPQLNERESFNNICRAAVDVEVAVLGCYTGGNVYVFNIENEELDGIRELTTAHELLHANWARMDDKEKTDLKASLEKVYYDNKDVLEEDLATYDESERLEELYVRAGTEVAKLPTDLEKHYAEIFSNQDLIVGFYNKYIKAFKEIETEMESLKAEMKSIEAEIDAKKIEFEREPTWDLYYEINNLVAEYNARVEKYNADIEKHEMLDQMMNSRAKVEGVE